MLTQACFDITVQTARRAIVTRPDGKKVLRVLPNDTIVLDEFHPHDEVHDVKDGKLLRKIGNNTARVCVAFPQGKQGEVLAALCDDGNVRSSNLHFTEMA